MAQFRLKYHRGKMGSALFRAAPNLIPGGGNMSGKRDNLIVGLDIGTTKICAIVGNVTEDGLDIVGIGTSPSRGLRKGVVINIESTVASIKKAVEEAELMAGC